MKQLSKEEWIAVTIALILGIAMFMLSFFLSGFRSLESGLQEGSGAPADSNDVLPEESGENVVSNEVPAPGFEGEVEETVVIEERVLE